MDNQIATVALAFSIVSTALLSAGSRFNKILRACQGQSVDSAPNTTVRRSPLALTTLAPLWFAFCICTLSPVFLHSQVPTSLAPSNAAPTRDPNAVALIESALTAMGGDAAWSGLHGAITTGSYVRNGDTASTTFTWSDDWSGDTRMRRENVSPNDGRHSVYMQDASSQVSSTPTTSSTQSIFASQRPSFGNISALIAHLPGAALFLALQKPVYAITIPPPSRSAPPNTSCVRIRRTPPISATRVDEITMCFSTATSVPVSAYIPLPNLFHPNQKLIQSIQYQNFQRIGPVLVPQQVALTNKGQQPKTITITSASWNPAFTAGTFLGVSK